MHRFFYNRLHRHKRIAVEGLLLLGTALVLSSCGNRNMPPPLSMAASSSDHREANLSLSPSIPAESLSAPSDMNATPSVEKSEASLSDERRDTTPSVSKDTPAETSPLAAAPTEAATQAPKPTTSTTEEPQSPDGRRGAELDTPYRVRGIELVNKNHWGSRAYKPVKIDKYNDRWHLRPEAMQAWKELQAAAKEAGFDIRFYSGYRSYEYQEELFNGYVAVDGLAAASRYSARPGQSEHQLGLALDMSVPEIGLEEALGKHPAGQWLAANSWRYGWILRYLEGKESVTGYMYEPWHFRYVGKEVAAEIGGNPSITLEEYLGVS